MDLPTYTNIWRIEKRLYKLYDLRLPMPLPLVQIGVFAGVFVPWIVLLRFVGVPFASPWHVLYIVPPGVLTWLATRPVIEGKRLTELLLSQSRFLAEPRTWCRLTPIREPREVVVVARVWRRADAPAPAAAPERAAIKSRRKSRRAQPAVEEAPVPVLAPSPAVASAPQPLAEYSAQRQAAANGPRPALAATRPTEDGHVHSGELSATPHRHTPPWARPTSADTAAPRARTTADNTAPRTSPWPEAPAPRTRATGADQPLPHTEAPANDPTTPWAQPPSNATPNEADTPARSAVGNGHVPSPGAAAAGEPGADVPGSVRAGGEDGPSVSPRSEAVPGADAGEDRRVAAGEASAQARDRGHGPEVGAGRGAARDENAPREEDAGQRQGAEEQGPATTSRRAYVVGTENDVRVAGPESLTTRKYKPWRRRSRDIAHEDDMWVAPAEPADAEDRPGELDRPPATPRLEASPSEEAPAAGSGKRAFASGVRRPGGSAEFWQAAESGGQEQPPAQAPPETRPDIPRQDAPAPAATRPDIPRVTPPAPVTRPDIPVRPPQGDGTAAPKETRPDIPMVPGAFGGGGRPEPPEPPEPREQPQRHAEQDPRPVEDDEGVERPPAEQAPKPLRPATTDARVWPSVSAPRREDAEPAPQPAPRAEEQAEDQAEVHAEVEADEPPREVRSGPASPIRPGPPPAPPRPRPRPVPPPPEPPAQGPAITPPDPDQQHASPGGLRRLLQAVGGGHGEADAEYEQRLQQPFQGTRHIVVLGCTGGAGQTVTALMLGHTFAQHNGEPVVAIDINPGPGALARRTRSETNETLTGLITRADQVTSLTAMRRYTSQARSGLDVIAAGKNPLQALDDRDYALAIRTIDKFYSVTLLDAAAAVVARVLPYADQLVLVAPASADAPRAVAMTFEWLDGHGYSELRSRAVTVINGVSRRSMDDVEQAESVARGRCRALVRIPWDDHLSMDRAPRNELRSLRAPTRRAYLALAGVVAGGFTLVPERYQEPQQQEQEATR
ncbi:TcpE family conjugal transfer membrane protein [Actinomadura sp. NPDC047616]|uniref:TcpE family conjugal transfer membrane protein n=1 Tax=Actinomadura sp. NPDC047616 TaxID=3155914 RepID=UPI0033C38D96